MEGNFGSVFTVLSFVVFIGIVIWALSKRRKRAFDEASRAPFALPDETAETRRQSDGHHGTGASQ
jgi:cytochrome c oxidase cbb3-type subunit IV